MIVNARQRDTRALIGMAITAAVTITVAKVEGFPEKFLYADDVAFVLGSIDGHVLGRSRPLDWSKNEFDFGEEPLTWEHFVAADGRPLPVEFSIYLERYHEPPERLFRTRTSIAAPYESGPLVLGDGPRFHCEVSTHTVSPSNRAALVPRLDPADAAKVTLRVPQTIVAQFGQIRGLYAPTSEPGNVGAQAREGYRSEDDRGRAFLEHDLEGKWKKDTQQIELTATLWSSVHRLPADARVKWTVIDVDDPSNDVLECHHEAGRIFDPQDYHPDERVPVGATGSDNEGNLEVPPWEAVPPYALEKNEPAEARTTIVDHQSTIVFQCPRVAGDNFMIRAEVVTDEEASIFPAQTGVITMWHRFDVEYCRMESAPPLPIDRVAPSFEPACVQFDFHDVGTIPDRPFVAPTANELEASATQLIDDAFQHLGEPGWFCLIAALESNPLPGPVEREFDVELVYSGAVSVHEVDEAGERHEYLVVPGNCLGAKLVTFTWDDHRVSFFLQAGTLQEDGDDLRTLLWIQPHVLHRFFEAGDGSTENAYRTNHTHFTGIGSKLVGSRLLRTTSFATAEVYQFGRSRVSGISPRITRGGKSYFAGRTVVFTHHPRFYDREIGAPRGEFERRALGTLLHELGHALGFPHKCGNYDYRTPRRETCCMNYRFHWIADRLDFPVLDSNEKRGLHFCALHIKEMRRVQMSKNKGLNWS